MGCHFLLQGIFPTLGSNPGLPRWQVDSLPSEPPGKPKNTGAGSLSLLQGIFPTQESNQGLLHWQLDSLPSEPSGTPHGGIVSYNPSQTNKSTHGVCQSRETWSSVKISQIQTQPDILYLDQVCLSVTPSLLLLSHFSRVRL